MGQECDKGTKIVLTIALLRKIQGASTPPYVRFHFIEAVSDTGGGIRFQRALFLCSPHLIGATFL